MEDKLKYSIVFLLFFITIIKGQDMKNELQVVNKVDLNKYKGLWYEVAKIPNWFQKKCLKNTTAEYSIRNDGKIKVVNSCIGRQAGVGPHFLHFRMRALL